MFGKTGLADKLFQAANRTHNRPVQREREPHDFGGTSVAISAPYQDVLVFGTESLLYDRAAGRIEVIGGRSVNAHLQFDDDSLWRLQRPAIRAACSLFFHRRTDSPAFVWTTRFWFHTLPSLKRHPGLVVLPETPKSKALELLDAVRFSKETADLPLALDVCYKPDAALSKTSEAFLLGWHMRESRPDMQVHRRKRIRTCKLPSGIKLSSWHEVFTIGPPTDLSTLEKTKMHACRDDMLGPRPAIRRDGALSLASHATRLEQNVLTLGTFHRQREGDDPYVRCLTVTFDTADGRAFALNYSTTSFTMLALQHPQLCDLFNQVVHS